MANHKPIDEVRIGRVKATIWKNGTEDAPRYNVTFSRLYKDGDQWKSYAELRAERSSDACKSGGSRSYSHLLAPPGAARRGRGG